MDFIRAWEYDYVCGHRADAINRIGNIRMINVLERTGPGEASCYIFEVKPNYVPFDQ